METTMSDRWTTPAISLLLGLLLFGAAALGGDPATGVAMFAVMVVYSLLLVALGGRSETVGILTGRPADERLATFGIHATAVAGIAAILVAVGGFLWSIAHGQSGNDFAVVAATGAVAYLGALLWFRWRG
jgi:hypothetical protein